MMINSVDKEDMTDEEMESPVCTESDLLPQKKKKRVMFMLTPRNNVEAYDF